ncbi:MAG: tetratricopeptide repeat protein, partial [Acidobacteriota bacterium]
EWLTYEFTTRKPDEAVAEMQWEDLALPWTIRVDHIEDVYISQLKNELRNSPGFNWQILNSAAQYALGFDKHLDTALAWADMSISFPFVGQPNFTTLSTKAAVLAKMGRDSEAKPIMEQALNHPSTTRTQLHQYGRQLLIAGKKQEALDVFLINAKRNGDAWPVEVGLARGYLAVGDTSKALEHAKKAAAQAPDPVNKRNLDAMVKALSEGKPFNN